MTIQSGVAGLNEEQQDIICWFDGVAESAASAQTETLRRIIEMNHGTEYLSKWLGSDTEIQQAEGEELERLYTRRVPLANHADLEPYIQRIADGDDSPLLTQEPITTLSLSSGTTDGRPKYVPFTRYSSQSTLQIFKLAAAHRSRVFPLRAGGRILELIYSSKQFKTKGGVTAGTATTHYYASEEFRAKQKCTESFACSPLEVILEGDYKQSTYCHLLLGLYFCDQVDFVTSTFAYSMVHVFTAFEGLWEEICHDIRHGSLSNSRVTSPRIRRAVLEHLSPNPSLALKIESKCRELQGLDWCCTIPELWPNAKYIYSIMTGSMQPYLKKLRHYAGELPLVCADYGSTESWIGVNLDPYAPPQSVTFTVIPTLAYFEFIPLVNSQHKRPTDDVIDLDYQEGEPLPLSQVKLGQQYELVLTTYTGLYRYRLGDVVEVASFYKGAPQLTFVCRRKLILTINIDKNTEKDLQLAVERSSQLLAQCQAELVDFTSHADTSKHPGHYVIYWEIKAKDGDEIRDRVLQECCREMDASFADYGYVVSRRTHSIGPLELRLVKDGTFGNILEHYISNGATMSQFKTPRCTNNPVLLRILDHNTVKHFWSTAYG
ncbi:GH3 family protein [Dioscorea alata]|uniref:GH3 family protein n=1 Tax=Dioscorea alata TaxID=55571 RepID=A0ACB7VNY3_DIOAL|nr:GH3 family protein [Dioscorea alata]